MECSWPASSCSSFCVNIEFILRRGVAAVATARPKLNAKASKGKQKLTEAQIAVHWKEEEYFRPSKKFIAQANLADPAFVKKFSEKNFPGCFDHYASLLDWDKRWSKTLDTSNPPFWKWFVGGKLNACYNCVDRHLAKYKNKAALIFVPEPESESPTVITYQELYKRVNDVAALLRDFAGLKTGDRVTIHMPMIPAAACSSTPTAITATASGWITRPAPISPCKPRRKRARASTRSSFGNAIPENTHPNRP